MPIAELAGGMQVLHIAAEERKPNEYVAVLAVQRLEVRRGETGEKRDAVQDAQTYSFPR
jgi:hypothetical protein